MGAPRSCGALDRALAELDRGGPAALELVGEPGIGKTRLLAELAGSRRRARAPRARRVRVGARARLAVLGVRRRARRVRRRGSSRVASRRSTTTFVRELAHVLPSLSRFAAARGAALPARALPQLTARCASCSSDWRRPSRSCSCSTTCTGLTRIGRAARCAAAPAAGRRRADRAGRPSSSGAGAAAGRARARAPRGRRSSASSSARSRAARRASSSARRSTAPRQPLSTRRAAATRSISSSSPARSDRAAGDGSRPELSLTDLDVPPAVAAALAEELALLSDGARLVLEGAAVAGDPFEPELAAAAAATSEASALEAAGRAAGARPRARDRGAASLSLPAPARPAGGLRVDARRLATGRPRAQRRGARGAGRIRGGARAPRRALGAPGRRGRRRDSARGRRGRRAARARERRDAGSATRSGSCPTPRRPRSASSSCSRARGRWSRPASSPTGTRRCSRASRSSRPTSVALRVRLTTACAGVEHLLGRHEQAHARLASAMDGLRRPRLARGGGAHDRARDGRLLPHGLRADARVGRASAQRPHGRSATGRSPRPRSPCSRSQARRAVPPRRPKHSRSEAAALVGGPGR